MRLIQLEGREGRRVGHVEDNRIRLLLTFDSIFSVADAALE